MADSALSQFNITMDNPLAKWLNHWTNCLIFHSITVKLLEGNMQYPIVIHDPMKIPGALSNKKFVPSPMTPFHKVVPQFVS